MADFDNFERKRTEEKVKHESLVQETEKQWKALGELVSKFAQDGKGIQPYKFNWLPDLMGHPMLVLYSVAATFSNGSGRDGKQSYAVRFSRKPETATEMFLDPPPLAIEDWPLQPDILGNEFVWYIPELEAKLAPAKLADKIAVRLAEYHVEYERFYGR
jgi:hypothetical protein